MSRAHRIVGLGNPLLDISAVTPMEFLEKYGLRLNNAILAADEHASLYEEMGKTFQCAYLAGGATQNTTRVAQWMMGAPGAVAYMGCVGADDYANLLRAALDQAGVTHYYETNPAYPTGTCACLIHGKERSLVANLGAAVHFSVEHLRTNFDVVENAEVIYSSGYFFTSSPESAVECAKLANRLGKPYGINLAAEFIIDICRATIEAVMPYTEYVFCNDSEMRKYGSIHGLGDLSLPQLAQAIANLPKENSTPRKVVVTCGSDSTLVATSGQTPVKFAVPRIDPSLIVDTNGAGDSFVGAFLAELVKGGDIARCVGAAHYTAGEVIQREGCMLPDSPRNDFEVPVAQPAQ